MVTMPLRQHPEMPDLLTHNLFKCVVTDSVKREILRALRNSNRNNKVPGLVKCQIGFS